jgi:hypothetical protein
MRTGSRRASWLGLARLRGCEPLAADDCLSRAEPPVVERPAALADKARLVYGTPNAACWTSYAVRSCARDMRCVVQQVMDAGGSSEGSGCAGMASKNHFALAYDARIQGP